MLAYVVWASLFSVPPLFAAVAAAGRLAGDPPRPAAGRTGDLGQRCCGRAWATPCSAMAAGPGCCRAIPPPPSRPCRCWCRCSASPPPALWLGEPLQGWKIAAAGCWSWPAWRSICCGRRDAIATGADHSSKAARAKEKARARSTRLLQSCHETSGLALRLALRLAFLATFLAAFFAALTAFLAAFFDLRRPSWPSWPSSSCAWPWARPPAARR